MKEITIMLLIAFLLFSGCTGSEPVNETAVPVITPTENGNQQETTAEQCNPRYLNYTEPVPADTSIPVDETLPGLKYSFGINDSGRTVTMNQGDSFEITLVYSPSLAFSWTLVVEPEGLMLLNVGQFTDASPDPENYIQYTKGPWNHRWRYLAAEEGNYFFDGVLAVDPCKIQRFGSWDEFNLTVVVI